MKTFSPFRTGSWIATATVAQRVRAILDDTAYLTDARSTRQWKSLNLRQWAGVLETFDYKANRTTICHWGLGDRSMPDAAYGRSIAWHAKFGRMPSLQRWAMLSVVRESGIQSTETVMPPGAAASLARNDERAGHVLPVEVGEGHRCPSP